MAFQIEDLIRPLTRDEIAEQMLVILEAGGIRARSWAKGGTWRVFLIAVATMLSWLSYIGVDIVRSFFLPLATGNYLTALALYSYDVERREATFATGKVTVTSPDGGIYEYGVGELLFVNPTTKKTYSNLQEISLVNPGDSVTVNVAAVEIGSASTSAPGTITEFVTQIAGLTVTNTQAVVATDAWSDAELRSICIAKLSTLSTNGSRGAFEFAVKTAKRADGSAANINRQTISRNSSQGIVRIYVASPSGAPITEDIDAVYARIEEVYARPMCVKAFVLAAVETVIPRDVTVWFKPEPGVDQAMIAAAVLQAMVDAIRVYPIGGVRKNGGPGLLAADKLDRIIIGAHPSIEDVEGTGADTTLAQNEVAVVVLNITVRMLESGVDEAET